MTKISKRTNQLSASPIRKFLPDVLTNEKRGIKVFKLNVGDPDITPPKEFLQAIKKFKQKNIGYAPSPGIKEHVKAWVKYYSNFNIKLKPENIIPTVGAGEAILMSMIAVADRGDEIIVFEPLYANFIGFAKIAGVKLIPITLDIKNNFALPKTSEIKKKITKKTKAIIIINPNNPTGTNFSNKEIKNLISIAKQKNLFIISDETYREIVFDTKPNSLLKFSQIKDRLIIIDSASKRFSLPGARIGCLVSLNKNISWALLKLAMIRLSAPTIEQYGLIPLLKNSKAYTKKITTEYQKRGEFVFNALSKMPGVICKKPQGAFYIMAKLPVKNAEDFIKFMLTKFNYKKQTVLLTPASEFYVSKNKGINEVRIAYVLKVSELKPAMQVLARGLEGYLKIKK